MKKKLLDYLAKEPSKEFQEAYLPKDGGLDRIIQKAFEEATRSVEE